MSRSGHLSWESLDDQQLLCMRLCDLDMQIAGSQMQGMVERLHGELRERGIRFKPHVWFSDEWFTPDGVPGIAIPFYLASPRLRDLEKSQMLEIEGGTPDWCMRILRHEAGHALDNAYQLHRRGKYRELFGSWHEPYPDSYRPKPNTKNFVVHLDLWYAQSHPAEDFAETFAVWLNPQSHWRRQYAKWPALAKLEYIDRLIGEVAPLPPPVRTRRRTHTMRTLRHTLAEHYQKKRERPAQDGPGVFDRDLRRIFCDCTTRRHDTPARGFLESIRDEARMMVSRWTGAPQLTINRTFADMLDRVALLKLHLAKPPRQTKVDVMMMLAVQTMNYLNDGKHRVEM